MSVQPSIYERVLEQHQGRDPLRMAKKLALIAGDPFDFFRGTNALFFESLPVSELLHDTPRGLCCGDLHLENFGSFRGANRLVYFDLNDFDEACVAPLAYEVLRFLASVHAGAASLGLAAKQADKLCRIFLQRYAAALAEGKPAWLERPTARGLVKQLLDGLRSRHRLALLGERTLLHKDGSRALRVDDKRILAVTPKEHKRVQVCLQAYADAQPNPDFYHVLDIGGRVAGNGSLGVPRYIVLVEGRGGVDGHFLLDLKAANPSALAPHVPPPQPSWPVEGERVTAMQKVMSAMAPALLAPVKLHGDSFVLKELQPSADRLDLDGVRGDLAVLTEVIEDMAQLTAWAQLRGSARYGAALPDELMNFGMRSDWQAPLLRAAREAAERNLAQWQAFRKEHLQTQPGTRVKAAKPAKSAPAPAEAKASKSKQSKGKSSEAKSSEAGMPKAKAPKVRKEKAKDVKAKEAKGKEPKSKAPKSKAPKSKAPKSKAPKTKAPKTKAP